MKGRELPLLVAEFERIRRVVGEFLHGYVGVYGRACGQVRVEAPSRFGLSNWLFECKTYGGKRGFDDVCGFFAVLKYKGF